MKNSFFTFAILFLVLMPLAASVDKALPNENENGGKKNIFNTYTSKIAESGKFDKINAVFAEMSDSNECKKDIMEAIVIFAHDEHGKSVQADVYVDDNKIGTTPGSFYVPICSFKLMLKAKNKYFYQKLDMHKGNPIFINAVLKPELQWSQKASKIKSPENYCKNLNEGGHKDWRLPTIDDFKTAINCPSKLAGGDCEFSVES